MKSREYLLITQGRKIITAITATTAERILARTPVGIDLMMTWMRGGHVQVVVRWTITFQPDLVKSKKRRR